MKELSIEEKAKAYDVAIERAKSFIENGDETERTISESIFAGIMGVSEDENIRKELMECLKHNALGYSEQTRNKWFAWLEKQGEQKSNPYSGTSFKYNGHIWGMCARDNGVDILLDNQFLKHFENQGEQKSINKIEPKWKKGNDGEFLYEPSVVWIHNETKTLATAGLRLDSNTFYIPISELEKLPKEKVEEKSTDKVEPKFKKE